MNRFKAELEAIGALNTVLVLSPEASAVEYVCFTGFSQQWDVSVCDGERVWRVGISEGDMATFKTSATELNDCLREGKVDLLQPASDLVTLTLHCSSENTPTLKLSQLTPSECKKELGALILHLAKRTAQLTSELRECKKSLETGRAKATAAAVPDMPIRGGGKAQGKPKKPAGHSIVNPSSKRRKAATGVVFGTDENQ